MKTTGFVLAILFPLFASAQITTSQITGQYFASNVGIPFLLLTPDARAGALGETGVATSADGYSNHWNASKLAFAEKKMGLGISYTPWLRALVADVNLAYISFFTKNQTNGAIGGSLRYFSMGNITTTPVPGGVAGQYRPNEFALDVSYARKLSENFSAGMVARYSRSNLSGATTAQAGNSFGADISATYLREEIIIGSKTLALSSGLNISNIGSKIFYSSSGTRYASPLNARLGGRATMNFGGYHELAVSCDANNVVANHWPGGFGDQLRSTTIGAGMEYIYNDLFTVRAGSFFEGKEYGVRRYATLGAGVHYHVFSLDFAYLVPYTGLRNPLENTLRFSLQFRFDQFKYQPVQ